MIYQIFPVRVSGPKVGPFLPKFLLKFGEEVGGSKECVTFPLRCFISIPECVKSTALGNGSQILDLCKKIREGQGGRISE